MATFNEVGDRLSTLAARVPRNVDKLVRAIALGIDQAVVVASPVDTGRFRSNWIVSVGSPTSATRPPFTAYAKNSGPKLGETANANAAIADASSKLGAYRGPAPIYIQNNLRYAAVLNAGRTEGPPARGSFQQPRPAWVQREVRVGLRAALGAAPRILGRR